MHNLTLQEQSAITRYLSDPRSRSEILFQYAIYFIPSLLFGLYGFWKGDLDPMAVAYVVLVGLIVYMIQHQSRTNRVFRSAISKLVEKLQRKRQHGAGCAAALTPAGLGHD